MQVQQKEEGKKCVTCVRSVTKLTGHVETHLRNKGRHSMYLHEGVGRGGGREEKTRCRRKLANVLSYLCYAEESKVNVKEV